MVAAMEQEQAEEALKNVKKVPHHMGHSRNPSAASAISFCSVISEPISEVNEKEYGKLCAILNYFEMKPFTGCRSFRIGIYATVYF